MDITSAWMTELETGGKVNFFPRRGPQFARLGVFGLLTLIVGRGVIVNNPSADRSDWENLAFISARSNFWPFW